MNFITLLVMTLLVIACITVSYQAYKSENNKAFRTYCVLFSVVGWFAVVATFSEMVL